MTHYMDIENALVAGNIQLAIQHMQALDPTEICWDFTHPAAFNTVEKIAVLAQMPAMVTQLCLPCNHINTPEKRQALHSALQGKELTHIYLRNYPSFWHNSLTEGNLSLLQQSLSDIPNVSFFPNHGQAMAEPLSEPSISSDDEQEIEQGSDASLSSESDEDYWQGYVSSGDERGGGWSRGGRW